MRRSSLIIISIIVAIPIVICSILFLNKVSHQDDWKKRTTPLPKETRDLLCARFGLASEDVLCNGKKKKDIYALDFMTVIRDTFRPFEEYEIKSSEAATYYEVEEKIGEFQYECGSITNQADGLSYFVCLYDFRGDREFIVSIWFTHPEMVVMQLGITSRFED